MDNYENEEEEVVEVEDIEEAAEDVSEVAAEEPEEEEIDWEARAKKAESLIMESKAKAKTEKKVAPKADFKLSNFDMLALNKANIETEEDLDEVTRWADYNKVSVSEALKSNILKTVLAEKAELRNSAAAVNTGASRRANSAGISDDRLYADAQKGILPESSEDIARLARLRMKRR